MPDDAPGLMTIFSQALRCPDPAARAAYLDEVCRDDSALRRRVESLLAAHEGAGRFPERSDPGSVQLGLIPTQEPGLAATQTASRVIALEVPQQSTMVARMSESDGDATATGGTAPGSSGGVSASGQMIAGRYVLRDVLGEGGMGTVYRAEQTEPVRREVALKLIRTGMNSRAVLARFDAERQALALMDHPNIARVYDGGQTPNGQPFFVMELVHGVQITDYCDRHRLPLRARLNLFVAACHAVQHAHQKGIIHRDIKPSNVLVTEVDGQPTPKVIDFGVAKATAFQLTDLSLADTGAIVGTPTYMSPEQADPSSADIDTRTDVYALGVILYELLAGSPPIDAAQFRRGALLEMLRMIREVDPPRPSTKVSTAEALPSIASSRGVEPEQLKAALRGDLDWIVMKALEKDRVRRYETANGLAADVLRHLTNEPVVAAPPSRSYRLRKLIRRNRSSVVAASLVLVALVVGTVGTTLGLFEARRQQGRAETLATKELIALREAQALAAREARARADSDERAEQLAREDYVNRVNRAYREIQDDNVALAEDLLHGCEAGRRGWEWHFVKRLCNSERRVIGLGNTSVNALAYSPDSTWAVSGAGAQPFGNPDDQMEPTVDVWDVGSGRREKSLIGAEGIVHAVTVSPDGKKVAAGCSAGRVLVWDAETGKVDWTRIEPGMDAMGVAFSPDCRTLAVGYGLYSGDKVGRVKTWEMASGKELKEFPVQPGGANMVAFHPDGRRLAVAGSGFVEVWDLEAARKLQVYKGHKKWIYCLAYSPDGKWLATGGWDNTVKLWDAATGVETLTIFAHQGFVLSLAFGPDGRSLVTTSEDRSTRLWEVPSGRRLATFHGHTDFVHVAAFRPDGREIATGGVDGSIRFWDLKTSRPVVVEQTGWVVRLAYRRDGTRVLSEEGNYRTSDQPFKCWDPVTGELDATPAGAKVEPPPADYLRGPLTYIDQFYSGRFSAKSPDGTLVATSGDLGGSQTSRSKEYSLSLVTVHEAGSGRILRTLSGHSADVVSIGFSPDGRRLATASFDRTIKIWDTSTWQDVFTLRGHTAGVVCLAFSPNGDRLISGGIDFTARVWDATPLPPEVIAEHDARYRRKLETMTQLTTVADDARRAEILATGGQWGMAAGTFARAVAKAPDSLPLRFWLVEAYLRSGQSSLVGSACDELLRRSEAASDGFQALKVASFCRLARTTGTDSKMLQVLHEIATADNPLPIIIKLGYWDIISRYTSWNLQREPNNAVLRANLGIALFFEGKFDEAIVALGEAIRSNAADPTLHITLSNSLKQRGRFVEALASMKRAEEVGGKLRPPNGDGVTASIRSVERLVAMDGKLPAYLKGEYQPKGNDERLDLAAVCHFKGLRLVATRLFAEAFAADPTVADDLKSGHRFIAACNACLASADAGEAPAGIDDRERARLRRQALDWLRADLTLLARMRDGNQAADHAEVWQKRLNVLREEKHLGPVREPEALQKLDEAERREWQTFWSEVQDLSRPDPGKVP